MLHSKKIFFLFAFLAMSQQYQARLRDDFLGPDHDERKIVHNKYKADTHRKKARIESEPISEREKHDKRKAVNADRKVKESKQKSRLRAKEDRRRRKEDQRRARNTNQYENRYEVDREARKADKEARRAEREARRAEREARY